MKAGSYGILLAGVFTILAGFATAQGPGGPPPGGGGGGRQPGMDRRPPRQGQDAQGGDRNGNLPPGPPPPLIRALDVDHDGIISAAEIANAPAELKALDKNHDGKLTPDEFGAPRPGGGGGGGNLGAFGGMPGGGMPGGGPQGGGGPPGGAMMEKSEPAANQPAPEILSALSSQDKAASFQKNVKLMSNGSVLTVLSDGIPTHPTANFPTSYNPNRILKQDYHFAIPLEPKFAAKPATLPFGPIGVAINGIPFYNPYNAQGRDAVMGPNAETFDSCCGHPDQMGRYHYHKYPSCIKSPFRDEPGQHSGLLGWAFDGFALYGPNGEDGKPPKDLDECNGHTDAKRGYHYHVTEKFPYLLGAYKGVVEMSNFGNAPVWGTNAGGPPPPRN